MLSTQKWRLKAFHSPVQWTSLGYPLDPSLPVSEQTHQAKDGYLARFSDAYLTLFKELQLHLYIHGMEPSLDFDYL